MSPPDFFTRIPEAVIGLLLFLCFAGSSLVGIRLGAMARPAYQQRRRHGASGEKEEGTFGASLVVGGQELNTIQSAVLGMLGLILGFTFSFANERHDTRRQLVVSEANAVGTAWLRTELVAQPAAGELRQLLREYVDARLELASAGVDYQKELKAVAHAETLHQRLWDRALAATKIEHNREAALLLLPALNEVIDVHGLRIAAIVEHVPAAVIALLVFVATVALGMVGFGNGISRSHGTLFLLTLSLLIAAVVTVIVDLDRPRRGFITTRQQPLIDLQRSFAAAQK